MRGVPGRGEQDFEPQAEGRARQPGRLLSKDFIAPELLTYSKLRRCFLKEASSAFTLVAAQFAVAFLFARII